MTSPAVSHVPVLIVGGSIVGASAALFLAARDTTPVVIEKHPDVSNRLRAKLFYPRTMEAYRAVGIDRDIYAIQNGLPPADHAAVVESLAGAERRRWPLPAAADFTDVSPSPTAFVKQADLEEVVRAHALAAGADLRFGHRCLDIEQREDHVVARILDANGEMYTVTADYLLAADGNGSGVRERSGIGRTGIEAVAHIVEVGFQADLHRILDGRRLAMAWTDETFLSWNTAHDGGTVTVAYDPTITDPETTFDADRCREIVSRALGLPDSQITITGRRRWHMGGWTADAYRAGRVFLIGDAAHVTPPTGGFGANTGIQDAWNITAKLISVLRGDADPRLLDDYESERRPVGEITVEQALLRVRDRASAPIPDSPLLSEAAVAIGYRYPMPGIDDAGLPRVDEPGRWRGEPGTRLPHRWLDGGISTLDLVRGGRYLLLTAPDGEAWAHAARELDPAGSTLHIAPLPHPDLCGIGTDGALLVRPDHVIAWRAQYSDSDVDAALRVAVHRALGRVAVPAE